MQWSSRVRRARDDMFSHDRRLSCSHEFDQTTHFVDRGDGLVHARKLSLDDNGLVLLEIDASPLVVRVCPEDVDRVCI